MGIFDDAIREHLELKRQLGADDSELKRLEDEAFGPPSRPGESDFETAADNSENGGGAGAAEAETTVAEVPPPAEEPQAVESQPAVEEPPEVEEQPAAEHSVLEATEEPVEEPAAAGPEDEQATAIYDLTSDAEIEFGELDLELDEDDEVLPEEPEGGAERSGLDEPEEPAPTPPPDAPIESLETVEHPFPDELTEDDEELPAEPDAAAEPDEASVDEDDSDQEDDDDVLADTPEFLKDAPEDDELWFEQGKPKDFDF